MYKGGVLLGMKDRQVRKFIAICMINSDAKP